jgi:hypothetical protein
MNTKITVVLAAMYVLSLTTGIQLTMVYADEGQTNTDQALLQDNIGSGDSTNLNTGQNVIDSSLAGFMTCEGCFASFNINVEALIRAIEDDIEGFTLCQAIERGFTREASQRAALSEIGVDPDTTDSLIQCLRDVGTLA